MILRLGITTADLASFGHGVASNRFQTRLEIGARQEDQLSGSSLSRLTGCSRNTVRRWLDRFHGGEGPDDAPRSGRPRRLTDDVQLKAIAFYCQVSPLPGCSSWSLRWAEKYLNGHLEILGECIGHSSLQRLLKSHPLRPHLHKYFLAIKDPDFFPKMERLTGLYLNPPDYYFCLDECPGIQALRRLDPELRADEEGRPNYEGFDYERKGTLDLFAILAPRTGEVFGRCMPDHKTETFCRVFREHVETQPHDAQLYYVADNLSPHFHDDFCSLVAELSGETYLPRATGEERREWLQSKDKRVVVYFTPFHGSWLNMVEIWFGILNQKCLKHASFASVRALKEAIEAFIQSWNQFFAHPFTWKYKGLDLYAKAVRRFSKLLLIESPHLDAKFLAEQLLLMCNLRTDYPAEVPQADWTQLQELAVAKGAYLSNIIECEAGPIRRKRVLEAQERFKEVVLVGLP